MFVDHEVKKFAYKRGEEDMPLIQELFDLGMKLEGKPHGAIHWFLAIAYHSHKEKNLKNYEFAVKHYIESFKASPRGWVMDGIFKFMGVILLDPACEGFPKDANNSSIAKEGIEIMKKVSQDPKAHKCSEKIKNMIDCMTMVYSQPSLKKDDIMASRFKELMTVGINSVLKDQFDAERK
jgi:hypothetical protein